MGARLIGARVARAEDAALLTGSGCYVDDINLPGMLHLGLAPAVIPQEVSSICALTEDGAPSPIRQHNTIATRFGIRNPSPIRRSA